jgi:hypothetical protein
MSERERDLELLKAQAEAWQRCVDWFALLGPLNDHQRIPMGTLLEAEESNPYDHAITR